MSRPPDDAAERARKHLRRALLEGIEAALAGLEAAADPSAKGAADSLVAQTARRLDRGLRELRSAGRLALPGELHTSLDCALGQEIARWEQRSRQDPDARVVLRAFLGLRELLFELQRPASPTPAPAPPSGARRPTRPPTPRPPASRPSTSHRAPTRPRVQRFDVEG